VSKQRPTVDKERSQEYLENALIHYLDFLSQISLLTPKEERKLTLILRDKECTHHERELARKKLIESNLRLVLNLAKQYRNMGIPFSDLISEGNIGLMTAIDKFDPFKKNQLDKHNRLSTYATWWIRQRILRYIISNQSIIRVPEHIIDKINKLKRETERFRQRENREPTITELAEQTYHSERKDEIRKFNDRQGRAPNKIEISEIEEKAGMSEEDILKFSSAVPYIMSLEGGFEHSDGEEMTESSAPIAERVAADNELFVRTLDHMTVRSLLQHLDDKERYVICRRFGLSVHPDEDGEELAQYDEGATLECLARERGVSRERIRQIEREALRKMRKALGTYPGGSFR